MHIQSFSTFLVRIMHATLPSIDQLISHPVHFPAYRPRLLAGTGEMHVQEWRSFILARLSPDRTHHETLRPAPHRRDRVRAARLPRSRSHTDTHGRVHPRGVHARFVPFLRRIYARAWLPHTLARPRRQSFFYFNIVILQATWSSSTAPSCTSQSATPVRIRALRIRST